MPAKRRRRDGAWVMLERSSLGGRARPAKKSKPWKRLEFAWLNLPPQLVRQLPQLWELRYEDRFNHRFSIGSWMINDLGRVGRGLYRLRKIHSGRFWEGKGTTSVVPISSFPSTLRACFSTRGIGFPEFFRSLLEPCRFNPRNLSGCSLAPASTFTTRFLHYHLLQPRTTTLL